MKNPQFGSHDQVYAEYLIPNLLQTFEINPWTIWLLNLTVQVSSSLQFYSNRWAEKTLNLSVTANSRILVVVFAPLCLQLRNAYVDNFFPINLGSFLDLSSFAQL